MRAATISEADRRALASTLPTGVRRQADAPSVLARTLRTMALLILMSSLGVGARELAHRAEERYLTTTPPLVDEVDVYALYIDDTLVPLVTSAAWEKVSYVATRDQIRSDVTLWRRMRFEDWDSVPAALRVEALNAMLARYRPVLTNPQAWDHMTPHDWDLVPHPIRALAFRHMAEYWSGYYQLGAEYGIPRRTMADTLAALLMTESWFEHRAVFVNPWGNRDIGVAQAADSTRARMVALYDAGVVDALIEDEDYYDPWKATRFEALWVGLLLDEVGGDLDAAIRAYHRGSARALRGEGQEYLEMTRRRLSRFIRNDGTPGAWDYLWRRDQALTAEAWPWLSSQVAGASDEDATRQALPRQAADDADVVPTSPGLPAGRSIPVRR